MSQKNIRKLAPRNMDLIQADDAPAPRIEQEFVPSRLHENAGAKSLDTWRRRACPQKSDFDDRRNLLWWGLSVC